MKTIGLLSDLLTRVADIGKRIDSSSRKEKQSLVEQCEELLNKEGEATGLALAAEILTRYSQLSEDEKISFFENLQNVFGVNETILNKSIQDWQANKTIANARALHFACEPRSQNLCRRLNQASNATLNLVQMRSDLLRFIRQKPELKSLDKDFEHLFSSWFNRGFIELERIDWNTPAAILEKIIAYEAVHQIKDWDDLQQRVAASDRRLYGYFHPALGTEPLIFVEVALMKEVPGAIQPILEKERNTIKAEDATTAVFYSISNCQSGLKGISFGNFLIKQVVETLRKECESLKTFITLSPVPGFRKWATQQPQNPDTILNENDLNLIGKLLTAEHDNSVTEVATDNTGLKKLLTKYLVQARSPIGGAADPVSRFHLGNGARLENVHLLGDVSKNGLNNAWGCMVNYQYHVDKIETNHEAYVNQDRIIASSAVTNILKES